MFHVYEFEVFKGEGCILALPYDMPGGTQGPDAETACKNAARWLKTEAEQRALRNVAMPKPTFGNRPKHGGDNAVVVVNAGADTVPRVSPAAAARLLGLTHGEVSRLVATRKLEPLVDNGRVWITEYSINALKAERAHPRCASAKHKGRANSMREKPATHVQAVKIDFPGTGEPHGRSDGSITVVNLPMPHGSTHL